jgi:Laminin G domain
MHVDNVLDARKGGRETKGGGLWHVPEFSVSLLVRLNTKLAINFLVVAELATKESWRLVTEQGTGFLTFVSGSRYGVPPVSLVAREDICDQAWHQVRLMISQTTVRIFIDGKPKAEAAISLPQVSLEEKGTLWLGCFPAQKGGCDGFLGDIQLTRDGSIIGKAGLDPAEMKVIPSTFKADITSALRTVPWAPFAGTRFTRPTGGSTTRVPQVKVITFPDYPGAFAVWGALGSDLRGQIWVSGASHYTENQSAQLFRYDPNEETVTGVGDVLSELKRVKVYRPGEQQVKVHTKFIAGKDGFLYFATMDDPRQGYVGEEEPPWGSHLWRIKPGTSSWEHLTKIPEGLIALAGNGTDLYGLGFPNHTLFRFDIKTRTATRIQVGSVEGHVSRHLICDYRGHVYVPRLKYIRPNDAAHTLVEFNRQLKQVGEYPLPYYQNGAAQQCHGIIAYQTLLDHSIVFTTHAGRLFRIVVPTADTQPSRLDDLGWFHNDARSYASGLYALSGESEVVGFAQVRDQWSWVRFNLSTRQSTAQPFPLNPPQGWSAGDCFLYGCSTRDDSGALYAAGGYRNAAGKRAPVMLRIRS